MLVVAGDQVIAQFKSHFIAGTQFAVARWCAVIDLNQTDIDVAGGHNAGGRGAVGFALSGEVELVNQQRAVHRGGVAQFIALVDVRMRIA
ncbi:hypothetical protein D3C87_1240090 [compost metagenome]